jgi:hypothetical protein
MDILLAAVNWFSKTILSQPVPSIVFRTFVSQGPVPVAGASSVS